MRPINQKEWDDAQDSNFESLPVGGYVCTITNVTDNEEKGYLNIVYDIAEGPYKGHYSDEWGQEHSYAHSFNRSYTKALGMLKRFLSVIDKANGTNFSEQVSTGIDEKKLIGKKVGLVISGKVKTSTRGNDYTEYNVDDVVTPEDIRSGNYKEPSFESASKPEESMPSGFIQADNDVPF